MQLRSTSSRGRGSGKKRPSTNGRQSTDTANDVDSETSTQRSKSSSAVEYRFRRLASVKTFVDGKDPPREILDQLDAILERKVPASRKRILRDIANNFCKAFQETSSTGKGKDDGLEIFIEIIFSMSPADRLTYARKAGVSSARLLIFLVGWLVQSAL